MIPASILSLFRPLGRASVCTALLVACWLLAPAPSRAAEITYLQTMPNSDANLHGLTGVSDIAVSPDGAHVYAASYAASAVSVFQRDRISGELSFVGRNTGISAAFNVDITPDGRHVYAASPGGLVYAFARDADTGLLTETGSFGTGGGGTGGFVSLSVSPDGAYIYAVGGSPSGLVVLARDSGTGALEVIQDLKDNVDGNALGQLYGPQISPINNIATSSDSRFVYVTSTADNAVIVFARDATTGLLNTQQILANSEVPGLQATSSLLLSPDDRFLHVSGQGAHSLVVLSRDATTGLLAHVETITDGSAGVNAIAGVRSLANSPDGRYLYASAITDNAVSVFNRDVHTGALELAMVVAGSGAGPTVAGPSGMVTDPLSQNLYVANQLRHEILVFQLPIPAVVLSTVSAAALEGGAPITLDSDLRIHDADDLLLTSARVGFESGFVAGDVLSVTAPGPLAVNYDAATGELTLTGSAPLLTYQAALRSVQFQAGDDPLVAEGDERLKGIGFQVFDGVNRSSTAQLIVTVTGALSHHAYPVNSIAGEGGGVSPADATVPHGGSASFTVTPLSGYSISSASGCGGTLNGSVYTTGSVTSACAVVVSFTRSTMPVHVRAKGGGGSFDLLALGALLLLVGWRLRRHGVSWLPAGVLGVVGATAVAAEANDANLQAPHWYGSIQQGIARSDASAAALNRQLHQAGYDVVADIGNETRFAWRARVGYQWHPHFALELGYVNLGGVSSAFSGEVADVSGLLSSIADVYPFSAKGVELTLAGRYPLGDRVSATARVGALRWNSRVALSDGSGVTARRSRSGTDAFAGLGLAVGMGGHWELTGEASRHDLPGGNADMFTLGVTYRW